ncbi:hypothetical protein BC567DRAFT_88828 [Phyllosticta citribraziliensis]
MSNEGCGSTCPHRHLLDSTTANGHGPVGPPRIILQFKDRPHAWLSTDEQEASRGHAHTTSACHSLCQFLSRHDHGIRRDQCGDGRILASPDGLCGCSGGSGLASAYRNYWQPTIPGLPGDASSCFCRDCANSPGAERLLTLYYPTPRAASRHHAKETSKPQTKSAKLDPSHPYPFSSNTASSLSGAPWYLACPPALPPRPAVRPSDTGAGGSTGQPTRTLDNAQDGQLLQGTSRRGRTDERGRAWTSMWCWRSVCLSALPFRPVGVRVTGWEGTRQDGRFFSQLLVVRGEAQRDAGKEMGGGHSWGLSLY